MAATSVPGPNDIVIAVMGITGVGKSTFISHFTNEHVPMVGTYKCSSPRIPKFYLVDTPGFDDSERPDADVLKQLAKELAKAYVSNIILTGLIYLHRIQDVRFAGASNRNLRTFKKLTGENNLSSVVLGTTFWSPTDPKADMAREEELNNNEVLGWSKMLEQGATYMRQDQGATSGEKMIWHLVSRKRPVTLKIQTELVDEKKRVEQTEAGSELLSEMRKVHEREMEKLRQEYKEAIEAKDREWQAQIDNDRALMRKIIERDEKSARGLRERLNDWWEEAVSCVVM